MQKKRVETTQKFSKLITHNTKLLDSLIKSFAESTGTSLLIVSDNSIVFANKSATKQLGYSLRMLKEKRVDDLFIASTGVPITSLFAKVSTLKKPQELETLRIRVGSGKDQLVGIKIKRCFWKGKVALMMALIESKKEDNSADLNNWKQERLNLALKTAGQGIWDYDIISSELFISPEFFFMLGYNPNQINPSLTTWESMLHPESLRVFEEMLEKIKTNQRVDSNWEYQIKDKNNKYRWILGLYQVVEWDKKGIPTRLIGIHMDIDGRKKQEIEKDEYQKTLSGYIQNSHDGIVMVDENGIIREWNPVVEQIIQIKREQAIGKVIWDMQKGLSVKEELKTEHFFSQLKNVFKNISHKGVNPWEGQVYETTIALHTGEQKRIQQSIFTIKTISGIKIVSSIKDVTETSLNRIKIEKNEERLKQAMSAGNVGVWDIDFKTNERYYSPTAFTIFGYLPREIEPTESLFSTIIHPDDFNDVSQRLKTLLISGTVLEMELRVRRKNGDYIWILSKNRITRDEFGQNIRATGTITDITRQKAIENELRKSKEELMRNLKQHEILSYISYIINTNREFHWKNGEVIKLLGHFTNASRVYIFENNPQKKITTNTQEWCNDGITPQIDNLQEVPIDMVDSWAKGKDYLTSNDLKNDLPPEFAEMMIAQGIRSFLIFPLRVSGKNFGFIGFDECTYPREWQRPEIELLKTISNLISFSYEREIIKKQYQLNEQRYRELTEKLPQIIFEVNIEGRIDFLNQTGCDFFGVSKDMICKGFYVWNLFPIREVAKMKAMRNRVITAIDLEPVRLEVQTADKKIKPMVFFIRPRLEGGEIVNFSGIALQPDS